MLTQPISRLFGCASRLIPRLTGRAPTASGKDSGRPTLADTSTSGSLFVTIKHTAARVPDTPRSVRAQTLCQDFHASQEKPATGPRLCRPRPRPPDGRHAEPRRTRGQFSPFYPLLSCTRASLGGFSKERVRNHLSIYFPGSARQPLLHRKSNTRH